VPGEAAPVEFLFNIRHHGKPKGVPCTDHIDRWNGEQMLKASLPFVPAVGDKIFTDDTVSVARCFPCELAWCDTFGGHVVLLVESSSKNRRALATPVAAIFGPPTY